MKPEQFQLLCTLKLIQLKREYNMGKHKPIREQFREYFDMRQRQADEWLYAKFNSQYQATE